MTILKTGRVDEIGWQVRWLFTERVALLIVLVEKDWEMHRDQDNAGRAHRVRVQTAPARHLVNLDEMAERLEEENHEEEGVAEDEGEEVLVIAVAQAVVYERAVMVEVLNALVANGAVEGGFRLNYLAV